MFEEKSFYRKKNGFIERMGYEDNFNLEQLKFCIFLDVFF